jgi:hypothetical protein
MMTFIGDVHVHLRSPQVDQNEDDDKGSADTDNQSEEGINFDLDTSLTKCSDCNRKILGFLYQFSDGFCCSSCFHANKGSRVDNFSRIKYPGDKPQRHTPVISFDKESYSQMKREPPLGDKSYDWCCAMNSKNGKPLVNCFLLNFDDKKPFTATTTTFFSMKQNQDKCHGFFETSVIGPTNDKPFSLSIGFEGKQSRTKSSSSGRSKWGWTLTSKKGYDVDDNDDDNDDDDDDDNDDDDDDDDAAADDEDDNEDEIPHFAIVSGWKIGDTIGILCNFEEKLFSLYRNGIKEFSADIHWTGKFDLYPFVRASRCIVEICFDYDLCKFKPLEFSVTPGVPIPFEIFDWKHPCVLCESRFTTHMYMCVGDDTACHKFVVCSACFHSGKELQCSHEQLQSERVGFYDTHHNSEIICKHCEQPLLKHKLLGGKHVCPPYWDPDTSRTFEPCKVDFRQHDFHKFFRMKTPFDVPNIDDISKLVDRSIAPLFGELWTSPVDPMSELRKNLLIEEFESDHDQRQKIGVVVATDSLCESGCSTQHSGYCVRCSKHFKFHTFGRLCADGELSLDFGLTNDICSRCSHSLGNHHLVHLCLDDGIGRFQKNPNDQRIFIAVDDALYVERRGRISRLVPDPGPHHHRQVDFHIYSISSCF